MFTLGIWFNGACSGHETPLHIQYMLGNVLSPAAYSDIIRVTVKAGMQKRGTEMRRRLRRDDDKRACAHWRAHMVRLFVWCNFSVVASHLYLLGKQWPSVVTLLLIWLCRTQTSILTAKSPTLKRPKWSRGMWICVMYHNQLKTRSLICCLIWS